MPVTLEAIDPATGERIAKHGKMTWAIVNGVIDGVHAAFLDWRHTSYEERVKRPKSEIRLIFQSRRPRPRFKHSRAGFSVVECRRFPLFQSRWIPACAGM